MRFEFWAVALAVWAAAALLRIADRDLLQSWAPKFIDLGAPYRNSLRGTVICDCASEYAYSS